MGLGQSGANTTGSIVDIVTIDVDAAVIIDIRGIVTIVAGRPQPPPTRPYNRIPRIKPVLKQYMLMLFKAIIAFYHY